jgi:hypothetical protein
VRNPTPFFFAFRSLLFGKPKRSAIESLLAQNQPSRSFSKFQQAFGEFIPQALLAPAAEGRNSRNRLFAQNVTFWAFLAQVLERGSSCRDALLRVVAWWRYEHRDEELPSQNTSAYCKARGRLQEATLQRIGDHLADRLRGNVTQEQSWYGHHVKMVDGTCVSMPDTALNQQAWPQQKSQKPGCGFPLLKLVGLFCLGSGALLQTVIARCNAQDALLGRLLWKFLEAGDVLLADRAFCSYQDLHEILQRGSDAVLRNHQARLVDFRKGVRLGKNDRLVLWTKPAQRPPACTPEQFASLPATLTLRMLRYRVTPCGFRTKEVVLITTLLDVQKYPANALADLYFQRWSVELHFREIKTLLGMDVLRCLSPAMVRKELAMHRIAYNLVRALMQRAALCHHVDLQRLSFKGTLDSLHHFADAIQASAGKPRKQSALLAELLLVIARDLVPYRPFRSEPRAKKRRPKNYALLTRPRSKMKLNQHRNRWRRASAPKPSLS